MAAGSTRDYVQLQWPPRSPAFAPARALRRPGKPPRKRARSLSSTWPNAKLWSPACIDVPAWTRRSAIPTSNATPSSVSRSPRMVFCSKLFHPAPCNDMNAWAYARDALRASRCARGVYLAGFGRYAVSNLQKTHRHVEEESIPALLLRALPPGRLGYLGQRRLPRGRRKGR